MAYKINDYNFVSIPEERCQLQVCCGKKIYEFTVKDTNDYEMLLNNIKSNYEEFNHRIAKKIRDEFAEVLMYNLIIKEKRDLIIDKGEKALKNIQDIHKGSTKMEFDQIIATIDDGLIYVNNMYKWGWWTYDFAIEVADPILVVKQKMEAVIKKITKQ